MEEKLQASQYLEKSKLYNSPNINRVQNFSKMNETADGDRKSKETNLRHKLDNAFSDLENLRKALKDIKVKSDNSINQNSNKFSAKNINDYQEKTINFSPRTNHLMSLDNNSIFNDEINGGSRSRSNSNNKTHSFNPYLNQKTERNRNSNYKTPKGSTKSNNHLIIFFCNFIEMKIKIFKKIIFNKLIL